MFKETGRFQCRGDNGRTCIVVERTKILTFRGLSGTQTLNGTRDYITADGQGVNWVDDDTFQIVMTDEILRRL